MSETVKHKPPVSRRVLCSMKARWERDLAMLEAAYPVETWEADYPELETIRNLATAIAQIDGVITGHRPHATRRGNTND